ncbi:hypothetical protein [Rhodanobacter sp. C05]|uniref:hypothetical protein n=1 Tax=Rhodanobacter sp. C05 TaxID=1945855 RepID=UPI00117B269D|nr:hypothetical protein [Rhodanobacter sp. C05]
MTNTNDVSTSRKQKPGGKFDQPSDELITRNTRHRQEIADSRDHEKQSGKGSIRKNKAPDAKSKPGKS